MQLVSNLLFHQLCVSRDELPSNYFHREPVDICTVQMDRNVISDRLHQLRLLHPILPNDDRQLEPVHIHIVQLLIYLLDWYQQHRLLHIPLPSNHRQLERVDIHIVQLECDFHIDQYEHHRLRHRILPDTDIELEPVDIYILQLDFGDLCNINIVKLTAYC